MNENKHKTAPWDEGIYRTGAVPRRKGGSPLVPILLVVVVMLVGFSTFMSLLNIRLFAALNEKEAQVLSLRSAEDTAPTEEESTSEEPDVSIEIQSGATHLDRESLSLQQIYAQCIDSVVSVSGQSEGTGLVVAEGGYIVTNCHVVEESESITVRLSDARQFAADLVGTDEVSGLAVLQIQAEDLTVAQFGDSEDIQVGDTVCAIGDPLGVELEGTLTNGTISAIREAVSQGGRAMTLLQASTGSIGGPLIDEYGYVVGITAKMADGESLAVPSATVKSVVEQLISQGYISGQPTLGITGETLSQRYQYYYDLPAGIYVTQGFGPLEAGDILISVDGQSVASAEDLTALLYDYQPGDTVSAVVFRDGTYYSYQITVEEAQ